MNLEILNVRVDRLRNIYDSDCEKEGISPAISDKRKAFELLWNGINSKRGFGWIVNPWVWVVEFKVV